MKSFVNALNGIEGTEPSIIPVSDSDKGASFLSLAESYRVDDPQTRIKILAENRGISPDRYREVDGEIVYQGDDGQWYKSEPDGFWNGAKQFGANMLGHAESIGLSGGLGAAVSAINPPLGLLAAALGGAGGEGIRKVTGNLIYDEPQTVSGNAKSMATEAAWAAAGEGAGQLVNKFRARGQAPDIDQLDTVKTGLLSDKAKGYGIDLTPGEASNLRSLLNYQALLKDVPETANIIDNFVQKRNPKIKRALYDYLHGLSNTDAPEMGFRQGVDAAEAAKGQLVKDRTDVSGKLFEAAKNDPVDLASVLQYLDDVTPAFHGTKIGRSLENVKQSLKDPKGNPKKLIGHAHAAKIDLDDQIELAVSRGQNSSARQLMMVKEKLLAVLEASPVYKKGMEAFRDASVPINELDKSLVGKMIRQKDNPAVNLSTTLFGNSSSPLAVKQAKSIITATDPNAWDAVVRGHIEKTFNDIAESATGEAGNLGGVFRKKLYGTTTKQRMLQNALNKDQFQALENLMEVFQATGRASKGQSMTAQRQAMMESLEDGLTTAASATGEPMAIAKVFQKYMKKHAKGKNAQKLANILTDPDGMKKLQTQVKLLREVSPESKQYTEALTTALAVVFGNEVED